MIASPANPALCLVERAIDRSTGETISISVRLSRLKETEVQNRGYENRVAEKLATLGE
jgi:hypothetical protein